ncbi:uncharacterized protein [Solanum tuberosum]|uniref:uncharacterized protein n=1 Tax=Solanum tuberosum TaxID=4113 RepID=UPI00073A159B|nr:PREDICTED: uncharacterized protein LOC107060294 [Solanum tuberosum]
MRTGKVVAGDMKGIDEAQAHEEDKSIKEEKTPIQQSVTKELQTDAAKSTPMSKVVQPLPKITPQFPQRLKKKNEDENFKRFLSVFNTLSINLRLVEALLEMPGYAMFMKELVTKKRSLDFETIEVSHSFSAIMTNETIKKKGDPVAFNIPCTIGMLQLAKALCDLGASINLMPYAIYKQLGLGELKSITMRLLMADRSIKNPVGILYDILIDAEIPIILGRPLFATRRALVDIESGELKFWVYEYEVTFNVCKSMKHPSYFHVVSTIGINDEVVASVSHLMFMSEPLETVLANYDESKVQGYDEVVAALSSLGEYSKTLIKLDVDLKNR